ncbi:MAG: hypothetical protein ACAH11_11650 [Sphingomonas sp.]
MVALMASYNQYDMDSGDPQNFNPLRVVHRILNLDREDGFLYRSAVKAYPWPQRPRFNGINDLVRHLGTRCATGMPDVNEAKVLDVPVGADAYVIIEIAPDLNWRFDPRRDGVTLGGIANDARLRHRNLMHFDPGTAILQEPPCPDCRIVCFSTLVPLVANQPINFNLIDAHGTPISVDPDIRYPGTGGDVGDGP